MPAQLRGRAKTEKGRIGGCVTRHLLLAWASRAMGIRRCEKPDEDPNERSTECSAQHPRSRTGSG